MDGILPVDKPTGITSFGVVARLRRHLAPGKIGHAGTLDPLATGLLLVLIGKATGLSEQLMAGTKVYDAVIRFGHSTTTDDREGPPLAFGHWAHLDRETILHALPEFSGPQLQAPPRFCAKKSGGIPLYRHARAHRTVDTAPREIVIHGLTLRQWSAPLLRLEIRCSKGTYVRSLARDLGQRLHCPAHLHALRRIGSGNFFITQALDLNTVELLPLETIASIAHGHFASTSKISDKFCLAKSP
jgi:tRNA pseudouridine55 synthase